MVLLARSFHTFLTDGAGFFVLVLGLGKHENAAVTLEHETSQMLRYFMNIGLVVYHADHDELSQLIILRPQWLINAVGRLIRDIRLHKFPCDAKARLDRGWRRFATEGRLGASLVDRLWPEHSATERAFLLDLMKKYNLAVPLPDSPDGSAQHLIPSMLPASTRAPCPRTPPEGLEYACTLTFVWRQDDMENRTWDAEDMSYGHVVKGFFPRLVGKAVQHMVTAEEYNESDFGSSTKLEREYAEVRSRQWRYGLALAGDDKHIHLFIDTLLHNPDRILHLVMQFVHELMQENSWRHFVPHCLVQFERDVARGPPETCWLSLEACRRTPEIFKMHKDCLLVNQDWFPPVGPQETYDLSLTYRHGTDRAFVHELFVQLGRSTVTGDGSRPVVFHDERRLPPGVSLHETIGRSIMASSVVVAIMSEGAVRGMGGRRDSALPDCLLFEWWFALELLDRRPGQSRLRRIVPALRGAEPARILSAAPSDVSDATYAELCSVWRKLKLADLPARRSAHEIVSRLFSHVGRVERAGPAESTGSGSQSAFRESIAATLVSIEDTFRLLGMTADTPAAGVGEAPAAVFLAKLKARIGEAGLAEILPQLEAALDTNCVDTIASLVDAHGASTPAHCTTPLPDRPGALLLQVCLGRLEGMLDAGTWVAVRHRWE